MGSYYDYENAYDATLNNAGLGGMALGIFFFSSVLSVIALISMCKIFKKANKPIWAVFVPFYNIYVLFEIAGMNPLLFLLLFVPFANIVIMILLYINIAKKFGKGTGFAMGMLFLGIIFVPILAFGDAKYEGSEEDTNTNSNINNDSQVLNNNQIPTVDSQSIDNGISNGVGMVAAGAVDNSINSNEIPTAPVSENISTPDNAVEPVQEVPVTPINDVPVDNSSIPETSVDNTQVPEAPVAPTPDVNSFNSVPETPVDNTQVPETPVAPTPDVSAFNAVPETPVDNTQVPETPVAPTPDVNAFNAVPETPVDNTQVPEAPVVNETSVMPEAPAVVGTESAVSTNSVETPTTDSGKKICKACGSEIPSIVSICPSCGTDNE